MSEQRPMRKWMYWLTVRLVAWCLRPRAGHNHPRITLEEMDPAVQRAWPRRDWTWRAQLYEDAQAINRARMSRA